MVVKVASKTLQNQILKIVKDMLMAQRNRNFKREQVAYNKLASICEKHHMDYADTLDKARAQLRKTDVNSYGLVY
jgi:signal transduction histidine kinase